MKKRLLFLVLNVFVGFCYSRDEMQQDSICTLFNYNQAEIPDADELLERLNKLDAATITHIRLVGYTDSSGSIARNRILAGERIKAVELLLRKSGLKHLSIETYNANETSGFRAVPDKLNRRVDLLFFRKPETKEVPKFTFELNKPLNLNINFVGGRADFLPESQANLEQLRNLMLEDTTLLLKLHGHVCCADDMLLSEKRAYAVMSYLIQSGIDPKRMISKGFSNNKPLVPEISEANKSQNRRVEAIFYR